MMKRPTLLAARALRRHGAQPWQKNNRIGLPTLRAVASTQSFHSKSISATNNRHPHNTSSRYQWKFLTPLKAKQHYCCFHSSDTTTNGDDNHDPYDRYRSHVMTDEVWQEIQAENEQTRRGAISDVALYDQVLDEMIHAAQRIPPPPPELGPTGKYAYSFHDVGDRRLYKRKPSSTKNNSDGSYQTVTDFHVDDQLLAMSLSVDESMVAYLLETTTSNPPSHTGHQKPDGGKQAVVMVRHVDSGVTTELTLPTDGCDISSLEFGPVQSNGLHSLFYVTNDHQGRPFAVWACNVEVVVDGIETNSVKLQASDNHKPVLMKEFLNPAIMVNVQRTKGCQYVAIQASTKTGNEIYLSRDVLASTTKDPNMTLVMPHQDGVVYHLDIGHDEDVYILISTDDGIAGQEDTIILREEQGSTPSQGPEFSLWNTTVGALPLAQPNGLLDSNSSTFICGAQRGHVITDMDIFKDFFALYERSTEDGTQRIRLVGKETTDSDSFREQIIMDGQENVVPMGCASEHKCTSLSPSGNLHYNAHCVRFAVESPAFPPVVYEYSATTDQLVVLSAETGLQTENLRHERIMVESEDGTLVPLSLLYREQPPSKKAKPKRAVLVGYGSYGEPLELSYDPAMQPLLKRGFVLAYAHTRGGGDLGKAWYHRGRLYAKHKAVEDYVACAQALSKSHQITAKAFSAGGAIVGAAVNQHPELFANVVLTNCFLDVKKTMGNPNLFLTEHEIDEFGDPTNDTRAAEAISTYCPVTTASQAKEQNSRFLIIGAFDDTQTPFWNALIYGRLMRKHSRAKNRVFIHIESHGGHHLQLHVAAMEGAFIIGNRASYFGIEIEH